MLTAALEWGVMDRGKSFGFIGVGSELLKGVVADENGSWLARFLSEKGHTLASLEFCPDEPDRISEALERAFSQRRYIILSGGLGPTRDDLTREVLARFFGVKLVEDKRAKSLTQESCYHRVPAGFSPLPNSTGKALGLLGEREGGGTVVALPGVPLEFREMFAREVYPRLLAESESLAPSAEQLFIKTWGISESEIFRENPNLWDELTQRGSVSCLPEPLAVDLVVGLRGSEEERSQKKKEVLELIKSMPISSRVWQVGSLNLPEYIQQKLEEHNFSLGFCESCTGGLAAHSLTNLPHISQVFKGSVVCYANEVKQKVLGVKEDLLNRYGAVSQEVAKALAEGGKRVLGVDYCLSYTGIAGPGGGSLEKPVGTVAIGLATPQGSFGEKFCFKGSREQLKIKFFKRGLFWLLQELRELKK